MKHLNSKTPIKNLNVISNCFLLSHSCWDIIPICFGLIHFICVLIFLYNFDNLQYTSLFLYALIYSVSISWNINSISHNFIHNSYFNSWLLNKLFSIILSITLGFSQTMYKFIHLLHHIGNMDKPDHNGNTIDTLSIYKYGSLGNPENVYSYIFKSYFRDDPFLIYKKMLLKNKREAYFSLLELFFMFSTYSFFVFINWKAILFILPFYYLGHSLSSLNGYYEHFGGNPNNPYLWAVSNYGKIYNITWMFNGYHAEHHYRPKVHWTKMVRLHNEIKEQQLLHGTKILSYPHAFGFLEK